MSEYGSSRRGIENSDGERPWLPIQIERHKQAAQEAIELQNRAFQEIADLNKDPKGTYNKIVSLFNQPEKTRQLLDEYSQTNQDRGSLGEIYLNCKLASLKNLKEAIEASAKLQTDEAPTEAPQMSYEILKAYLTGEPSTDPLHEPEIAAWDSAPSSKLIRHRSKPTRLDHDDEVPEIEPRDDFSDKKGA